jgi:hypothetical protein
LHIEGIVEDAIFEFRAQWIIVFPLFIQVGYCLVNLRIMTGQWCYMITNYLQLVH